jgi:uncharacterized protein YjiS (DUF1127 family)
MKISSRIGQFFEMRKAYRDLSRLSDEALKDIGLSRGDVKRVAFGR